MIKTSVFLILQPERRGYDGKVTGIDAVKMLKTKPRLGVRDIAIQLNIEVDERIFITPEPVVTLRIDDERAVIVPAIEVVPQPEPEEPVDDLDAASSDR